MSLFPPKSIHHWSGADVFTDGVFWKWGNMNRSLSKVLKVRPALHLLSACSLRQLWIFVVLCVSLRKQMFPLGLYQSDESLWASFSCCFFFVFFLLLYNDLATGCRVFEEVVCIFLFHKSVWVCAMRKRLQQTRMFFPRFNLESCRIYLQ